MSKKEELAKINATDYDNYKRRRDEGFEEIFKTCHKDLMKDKSIYGIMQACFNAGYWLGATDVKRFKAVDETVTNIINDIDKQETKQ